MITGKQLYQHPSKVMVGVGHGGLGEVAAATHADGVVAANDTLNLIPAVVVVEYGFVDGLEDALGTVAVDVVGASSYYYWHDLDERDCLILPCPRGQGVFEDRPHRYWEPLRAAQGMADEGDCCGHKVNYSAASNYCNYKATYSAMFA